jgi:hypothetical protein
MKKRFAILLAISSISLSAVALGVFSLGTVAFYSWHLADKDRLMNHKQTGLVLEDRNGVPFFTFYQGKPPNNTTVRRNSHYICSRL